MARNFTIIKLCLDASNVTSDCNESVWLSPGWITLASLLYYIPPLTERVRSDNSRVFYRSIDRTDRSFIKFSKRTFFWLHSILTDGLPRLKSDWSITSSWMSDALWIISDTIATCRCESKRWLENKNLKKISKFLSVKIHKCIVIN